MLPETSRSSSSGSLTNVGIRRVKWTMPSSIGAVPPPEKCVQSSSGYE